MKKRPAGGVIYHAFDTTNGMCYVGQTTKTMDERMNEHLKSKKHDHFHNALRVRTSAFVWTQLTTCGPTDDLNVAEAYFGKLFEALHPYGYSLKLGNGKGTVSEETRKRMSVSLKIAANRPEVKAKKAATQSLPEVKKKMIASRKKTWVERHDQWVDALRRSAAQPEKKIRRIATAKRVWSSPDHRAKAVAKMREQASTPEAKAKRSAASKMMWIQRKSDKGNA